MQPKSLITKRFEFKYFLDPITASRIETYLEHVIKMEPDENSVNGPYYVNSLYFDTPQFSDYRDKDASLLIRKKVRARMYSDSWHDGLEHVWLEVKRKNNMNIAKSRTRISGEAWREFMAENNPSLLKKSELTQADKPEDLEQFVNTYRRGHYAPVSVVRYLRTAYLANFTSTVRITFDKDIRTCRAENASSPFNLMPVSRNAVIMEVKFNDKLPWWFNQLLTQFDLKRTDFSKYRNSLALMRGYQRIPISK